MATLRFFKGTSMPLVADGYGIGTVWFDKGNRVLKVRIAEAGTDADWEQYAGKLDDIELMKSGEKAGYLIVRKADGTNIEVNLNDIASAGSVAQAIQNLQSQLDSHNSKINSLEGKVDVEKVSTAISGAIAGLDAEVQSADGTHVNVKVTEVDGKVTAVNITESDIASASELSGVSSKVTTLEGKVDVDKVSTAISGAIADLDAEKESADGSKVKVKVTEVDGKITAVNVTETDIASKSEVDGEIAGLKQADTGLGNRLSTLETKVASFGTPLRFRGVMDNAPTEDVKEGDFYITSAGTEYIYAATGEGSQLEWQKVGDTSAESAAISSLQSDVAALKGKVDVEKVSTAISDAIAGLDAEKESSNGTHVNVKVTEADGKITAVSVTESDIASASELSGVASKVTTIEGKVDVDKVSTAISGAIADLDAEKESSDGSKVKVKVTEADGKITAVNVTETDIASASELSGAISRITAVETALTWGGFND